MTIKNEILNRISKQIDKQNEKGMKTYGQTLDDCPPNEYDWLLMVNEELIDALQYYQKEVARLRDNVQVTEIDNLEISD